MIPDPTSAIGMAGAFLRMRQSPIMDDDWWVKMIMETLVHEEMPSLLADEILALIEEEAGPLELIGQ